MKRKATLFVAAIATVALTASCATLFKSTAAIAAGKLVGKAVSAIYTAIKSGDISSIFNSTNLQSLSVIAKNIQDLREAGADSDYATNFAKGLVNGSGNLISESNSAGFTKALCSLAAVPAIQQLAASQGDSSPTISDTAGLLSHLKTMLSLIE